MAPNAPGIRLLPNAVTVLALCAGLSAVQFALRGDFQASIGAIGAAAVLDALDGRLARMLDATSKIGAELDSLADAVSFGVSPALVLYIWVLHDIRAGWILALTFAVCMVLRLARFNTLLEVEQPAYVKEFFTGAPAPAGALLALLPLITSLSIGDGVWTRPWFVGCWIVVMAALLISRIPTLSLKTIKVSPTAMAPLLLLIAALAAAIISFPFGALAIAMALYLAHIPYAIYRHYWLANNPEAWEASPRERRAIRRTARSARRLGLRPPLRRQVAGAAMRRLGRTPQEPLPPGPGPIRKERGPGWRRLGIRKKH
ncbi:phosphatidylcholine/phosphatidylserine synthase [Pseudonocardiaceae bacterium YIM PH 21723]|nr:phosphatidylcholine/phosphatidylserine synthase [Pseudonocardiaceae bacterium YIM PH 21723]